MRIHPQLSEFRQRPQLEHNISPDEWVKAQVDTANIGNLWRVHDGLYDLTNFARFHPGGEDWIRSTRGMDVTELFEIYHVMPIAESLLPNFFVRNAQTPRNSLATFHPYGLFRTIKGRVAAKYAQIPRGPSLLSTLVFDGAALATVGLCLSGSPVGAGVAFGLLSLSGHAFAHHRTTFDSSGGHSKSNWRRFQKDFVLSTSASEYVIEHCLSHHCFPNTENDLELAQYDGLADFALPLHKVVRPRLQTIVQAALLPLTLTVGVPLAKMMSRWRKVSDPSPVSDAPASAGVSDRQAALCTPRLELRSLAPAFPVVPFALRELFMFTQRTVSRYRSEVYVRTHPPRLMELEIPPDVMRYAEVAVSTAASMVAIAEAAARSIVAETAAFIRHDASHAAATLTANSRDVAASTLAERVTESAASLTDSMAALASGLADVIMRGTVSLIAFVSTDAARSADEVLQSLCLKTGECGRALGASLATALSSVSDSAKCAVSSASASAKDAVASSLPTSEAVKTTASSCVAGLSNATADVMSGLMSAVDSVTANIAQYASPPPPPLTTRDRLSIAFTAWKDELYSSGVSPAVRIVVGCVVVHLVAAAVYQVLQLTWGHHATDCYHAGDMPRVRADAPQVCAAHGGPARWYVSSSPDAVGAACASGGAGSSARGMVPASARVEPVTAGDARDTIPDLPDDGHDPANVPSSPSTVAGETPRPGSDSAPRGILLPSRVTDVSSSSSLVGGPSTVPDAAAAATAAGTTLASPAPEASAPPIAHEDANGGGARGASAGDTADTDATTTGDTAAAAAAGTSATPRCVGDSSPNAPSSRRGSSSNGSAGGGVVLRRSMDTAAAAQSGAALLDAVAAGAVPVASDLPEAQGADGAARTQHHVAGASDDAPPAGGASAASSRAMPPSPPPSECSIPPRISESDDDGEIGMASILRSPPDARSDETDLHDDSQFILVSSPASSADGSAPLSAIVRATIRRSQREAAHQRVARRPLNLSAMSQVTSPAHGVSHAASCPAAVVHLSGMSGDSEDAVAPACSCHAGGEATAGAADITLPRRFTVHLPELAFPLRHGALAGDPSTRSSSRRGVDACGCTAPLVAHPPRPPAVLLSVAPLLHSRRATSPDTGVAEVWWLNHKAQVVCEQYAPSVRGGVLLPDQVCDFALLQLDVVRGRRGLDPGAYPQLLELGSSDANGSHPQPTVVQRAAHAVRVAVWYAKVFIAAATGGNQIAHHMFPTIDPLYLGDVQSIIDDAAVEFGVPIWELKRPLWRMLWDAPKQVMRTTMRASGVALASSNAAQHIAYVADL